MRIEAFESIGNNCEFGFVQRRLGHEEGGLLRWAIAQPEPLLALIRSGGENLYRFENLVPWTPTMVRDEGTGLGFHTKMLSNQRVFVDSEARRREIWAQENDKMTYLAQKFFALLAEGSKIFVYKTDGNFTDAQAEALAEAIAMRGPGRIMCVRADGDLPLGEVRHHGENLYFGAIDRFAPYQNANDLSFDVWLTILNSATAVMAEAG